MPSSVTGPGTASGDRLELHVDDVAGYLVERGVIGPGENVEVAALGGGVSHRVFAVERGAMGQADGPDLVVKQALARLHTAAHWEASTDRVIGEAAGLRSLAALLPQAVPQVVELDIDGQVLVIEHAPPDWVDWKTVLLGGFVEATTAEWLGTSLGTWQRGTAGLDGLPSRLYERDAFEQLRTEAFYEVLRGSPAIPPAELESAIEDVRTASDCLVHGDYSPKNVLIDPVACTGWIIDLEAAHVGSAAYDVAFLASHLVLKAVHLPSQRAALLATAARFVTAYEQAVGPQPADPAVVARHLGCLLVARVDGRSPAPYLTPSERDEVRRIGGTALASRTEHVSDVLDLVAASEPA